MSFKLNAKDAILGISNWNYKIKTCWDEYDKKLRPKIRICTLHHKETITSLEETDKKSLSLNYIARFCQNMLIIVVTRSRNLELWNMNTWSMLIAKGKSIHRARRTVKAQLRDQCRKGRSRWQHADWTDLVLWHEKRVEPVAHVGDSPLQHAPDHQGGGQGGSQGITVVMGWSSWKFELSVVSTANVHSHTGLDANSLPNIKDHMIRNYVYI